MSASPGLLAHIAVSKYQDALPLYRQETILRRIGVDIPRVHFALTENRFSPHSPGCKYPEKESLIQVHKKQSS